MLNIISDNFLVVLLLIFAPVSGYLIYEALKLKDRNEHLEDDIEHLKEDHERMLRTDKIKSEFMSIATHQLKSPLAKMKWALEYLITADIAGATPEQREVLGVAHDTSNKMIRLVNDLIGVKEMEESTLGYNFENSSVKEVIEKTIENFNLPAKQKNIKIEFSNTVPNLPSLMIDPWKINLALGNLVDNAIAYTPEGGKIEIKLESFGNSVRVSVKDNGIGIPEREKESIFNKFFRASNALKVKHEGTGLGLYISKNIIKVHGGELWFNSVETKGTTFYFTIPFDASLRARENIQTFVNGM